MGTYECLLLYNGIAWLGIQIEYVLGEGEGDCLKVDLVNYFLDGINSTGLYQIIIVLEDLFPPIYKSTTGFLSQNRRECYGMVC